MKNKQHKKISLKKLTIAKIPSSKMPDIQGGTSIPPSENVCVNEETHPFMKDFP